jgi:predicted ribosome quality control (RQC) complex YloA/Tae2 family protein
VAPGDPEQCDDAALAARESVLLLPFPPPVAAGLVFHPESWAAAAAAFLRARRRGARFARRQSAALDEARRRIRRLQRLDAHLAADRASLPEPEAMRRHAEALLAHAGPAVEHEGRVEVADPYDGERTLRIEIDPRLSLPANANRMFDRARRIERAGVQVTQRRRQVREDLEQARRDEESAQRARRASDLAPAGPGRARKKDGAGAGPRRYLTTRGLVLLVGRGARGNQRLTFGTAAPEDWWLHARDVPGAHVVLRDPEGRASAEDLREAAEVAAFFSDARTQPQADVHSTRRKHVRPAGGAGRVRVAQSDTVRVRPRDPEGRLRSR